MWMLGTHKQTMAFILTLRDFYGAEDYLHETSRVSNPEKKSCVQNMWIPQLLAP